MSPGRTCGRPARRRGHVGLRPRRELEVGLPRQQRCASVEGAGPTLPERRLLIGRIRGWAGRKNPPEIKPKFGKLRPDLDGMASEQMGSY